MNAKKNLCAMIPADLHAKVIAEKEQLALSTLGEYVELVLKEHFEGGKTIMAATKTLAFQISEELDQRLKNFIAAEKKRGRKITQKEFVIGLIEQALEEAEEEFEAAEAAGREEQEESAWDAAQGGETGEGDDPSTGLPSEYAAWSAPQEDEQEAADESEVDAETEDAGETEEAEEEIYA